MLMRARLPAHDELEEIYAPEYFRHSPEDPADGYADYLGDAEWHRGTARRRLSLIDRFASSRGRLLDVGAAAGFFVAEAIRAGWDAEGIDIAPHVVEWGRRELDVPLRVGEVSAVEEPGAFAVVTMWDYIEHSLDPAGDLARSNELLAPEGIVALSTGDVDSVAARLSRSRWHLLTPRHHNFFFGARTLVRLLKRCGFDVLWLGHPGARYSLAHLAYKFDRGVRIAPTAVAARRIASSRVGRYSVPVNLFDIVTVVARKVRQPVL
jgi:SAM-dependent methyltransferase